MSAARERREGRSSTEERQQRLRERGDTGNILGQARRNQANALRVLETPQACATRTLQEALYNTVQALRNYQILLNSRFLPEGVQRNQIEDEAKQTVENGYRLVDKYRACQISLGRTPIVAPSLLMSQTSAKSRLESLGSTVFTGTDAPILQRITAGIVTNYCAMKTFDQMIGSQQVENMVQDNIVNRMKFEQIKLQSKPINILFYGPPGTGKTRLVEAIVRKLLPVGNVVFLSLSGSDLKGTEDRGIKVMFEAARQLTQNGKTTVVLFVDEFDQILTNTFVEAALKSEMDSRTASSVTGVPGRWNNAGIVFIAATNYPQNITETVFQSFTHKVYIGLPTLSQIRQILMRKLHQLGWDRVNFTRDGAPLYLQGIDWSRELFLSDYQGRAETSEPPESGEWDGDAIDFLALIFHAARYSHRDLELAWETALDRAASRAAQFASGPPYATKQFFQRWLLEKMTVEEVVQQGNQCVQKEKGPPVYSFIPLSFTAAPDGVFTGPPPTFGSLAPTTPAVPLTEQQLNEQFLKANNFDNVIVGSEWGMIRKTPSASEGAVEIRWQPKFDLKNKKREVKVVVTQATVTDAIPVQQQLLGRVSSGPVVTYQVIRRQERDIPPAEYANNPAVLESRPPFVTTKRWTAPLEEEFTPDKLGLSQIRYDDLRGRLIVRDIPNFQCYMTTITRGSASSIVYGDSPATTATLLGLRGIASCPPVPIRQGGLATLNPQQQTQFVNAFQQFAQAISQLAGTGGATSGATGITG